MKINLKVKCRPLHARYLKHIRLAHPNLSGTWLDSGDVLRLLHCSERTLQSLRQNGAFPFYVVHQRLYLYKYEEIQAYVESCKRVKEERSHHD